MVPAVIVETSSDQSRFTVDHHAFLEEEITALKVATTTSKRRIMGTLECDSKFRITRVDKEAEKLIGCGSRDLVGHPITTLMSPLVGRIHQGLFSRIRKASPAEV
jgi:PAS domain-containing protein